MGGITENWEEFLKVIKIKRELSFILNRVEWEKSCKYVKKLGKEAREREQTLGE